MIAERNQVLSAAFNVPRKRFHFLKRSESHPPPPTKIYRSCRRTVSFSLPSIHHRWSQWPWRLRRVSAVARLLGLRVRIPPEALMPVLSVVCCKVKVSATDWSLVQRSPTDCGVSEFDRESSKMRSPWSTGGGEGGLSKNKINNRTPREFYRMA
jgi:hypothetical protein